MKVSLIGSGNVADQLGCALQNAGHEILEVYSRNLEKAQTFSQRFINCKVITDVDFSNSEAEIVLIAVSDNAIESVVERLKLSDKTIIAHTSGSNSLDILNRFSKAGVFYPLQTFSKERKIDLSNAPFCIEASNSEAFNLLSELATSLSNNVHPINSDQRKVIHLAAVFACNFSNHLISISEKLLNDHRMDLYLLKPLMEETIQKAIAVGAEASQTGPAKRGDEKITHQHLDFLKNEPEIQKIYQQLSEAITKKYHA